MNGGGEVVGLCVMTSDLVVGGKNDVFMAVDSFEEGDGGRITGTGENSLYISRSGLFVGSVLFVGLSRKRALRSGYCY